MPGPTTQKPNEGTIQRQNSGTATGNGVLRQGSQGSLFEQIANQAKDLVRETTRQSSQDGILAHMDKVLNIIKRSYVNNTTAILFVL